MIKVLTTDNGLFIDFTAKDIANIIADFYCDEKGSEVIFNACIPHFERCTITTRQQLIKALINKHYSGNAVIEMLKLADSFDSELFV